MGVSRAFPPALTALRRMHGGAADASEVAGEQVREKPRDASARTGDPRQRSGGALPVSLVCLQQAGVAPDRLLAATRIAAELDLAPEQVMLREDWIGERAYYRLLARWLGLHFVEEPFDLGAGAHYPQSIAAGVVQRADGAWISAPEGRRIEALAFFRRRAAPIRVHVTTPSNLRLSVERGFALHAAECASGDLIRRDAGACARTRASTPQVGFFLALLVIIAAAASGAGALGVTASILSAALIAGSITLRLAATLESAAPRQAHAPLADGALPIYSVIIALHREAAVAGKLVAALDALDYPRAKLDVMLVLEDGDHETREALERLELPPRYRIIVAPDGRPRTKPRALNIALAQARGSLVTVYDAEDEPEPDQLRKAAAAFAALPARVGCVQARLSIDNFDDGWLAKMFAIEYAALFEAVNPGLSSLDAPVALGGTSNHFRMEALRDCGGWDAWNVTEDIDLGFRLARHGYSVGALDSQTHEEAPARLRGWLNPAPALVQGLAADARHPFAQPGPSGGRGGPRAGGGGDAAAVGRARGADVRACVRARLRGRASLRRPVRAAGRGRGRRDNPVGHGVRRGPHGGALARPDRLAAARADAPRGVGAAAAGLLGPALGGGVVGAHRPDPRSFPLGQDRPWPRQNLMAQAGPGARAKASGVRGAAGD